MSTALSRTGLFEIDTLTFDVLQGEQTTLDPITGAPIYTPSQISIQAIVSEVKNRNSLKLSTAADKHDTLYRIQMVDPVRVPTSIGVGTEGTMAFRGRTIRLRVLQVLKEELPTVVTQLGEYAIAGALEVST